MTREERQRADRERKRRQRREQGMKTRAEYLAGALSVTRPWKAEGISRSTWYRRHAEGPDLTASALDAHAEAIHRRLMGADRPVPDRPVSTYEKALKQV